MNEFGQQKTDNDQFAEFVRWNYPRIDNGTKIEFERCWETAYNAGVQAERERCHLLAEAVLEAHSKHYPQAYHVGCEACRVAREVLSE